MYRCVLFDMDGTLIDSYTGIFHAYQWAVQQSGIGFPGDALVRQAIGAPLPYAFETLCGMDSDTTKQAVQQYREYYARKGWHEVSVYQMCIRDRCCASAPGAMARWYMAAFRAM